jgi:RNA polymerase sigma-70 factor (ECF subfamily)
VQRTALNVNRSWWRRLRREVSTIVIPEPPGTTAPDPWAVDPVVLQTLLALPRRQREVVTLRYLVDLSVADIAAVLGISERTVAVHSHRGLRRLQLILTTPPDREPTP